MVRITAKVEFGNEKVWPIGSGNMMFRRTTDRYARKGTMSTNRGYMSVKRDSKTGRFASI